MGMAVRTAAWERSSPFVVAGKRSVCSQCGLHALCIPAALSDRERGGFDALIEPPRMLRRGQRLYRMGESFKAIFIVRSGFLKTSMTSSEGREQVTGFQMAGDLLGIDGISSEAYAGDAVALEDSQVCAIPFAELEIQASRIPALQRHVHQLLSREIVRDQSVMLLLGSMSAEARVAAFMLNLSQRLIARGYSATEFNLRMTREEIGSYLGLKLETISRALSRLQEDGLVAVNLKHIRIIDLDQLRNTMRFASHR